MAEISSERSFRVRPDREEGPLRGIANLLRIGGDRIAGSVAVVEHPIAPGVDTMT